MTTFSRETLADVWDEAMPLLLAHYHEVGHFLHIPLMPDRKRYEAMEATGHLRVFTLRDDAKKLVGYAVYCVSTGLHHASSLQAFQDVLYVDLEHRGKLAGPHLISRADQALQEEGVEVVYQHTKAARAFGPLLEKLGYALVDLVYARRLN